jgi:hypothetical protein
LKCCKHCGTELSRGQFLTFTAEELKALDVESSKVVDLEKFVAGDDIGPVYFDSPYFVYPDGPIAVEVLRVIGGAASEGPLSPGQPRRLKSYPTLDNFRLSLGQKDFAAPQGVR